MAQQKHSALNAQIDKLSFKGQWHKTENPKWNGTIVFVPFYGAHRTALNRHVEFVNKFGFNAVTFELKKDILGLSYLRRPESFFSPNSGFGIKHLWADQIEKILNEIPGPKIIYAFSNPSGSALEAVVRRNGADIKGVICDSGPAGNLITSLQNYFKYESKIPTFPIRLLAASALTYVWAPNYLEAIHEDLKKFPATVPILSIRGWKDQIISANSIDQIFSPHAHLNWQKLSLPQAGHLNGLRDFAEEYEAPVIDFIKGAIEV
jgi:hypothetical protein